MSYDWYLIAREHGFETPKQLFDKMYTTDAMSMADLATEFGCSTTAVRDALTRFEIPKRQHGGTRHRTQISPTAVEEVLKKLEEEKQ